MKKILSYFLLAGLPLFASLNSSGQARLHIIQLDSFPQSPADTAYEGVVYHNIRIAVTNVGNTNFVGDIDVFLQSTSVLNTDTLRNGPHPPISLAANAADTFLINANPNYRFKTIHYAAGDNIIVVWPNSFTTAADTFQTQVYFVLLVGIDEFIENDMITYRNPISQTMYLDYVDENKVEQVRIYDLEGRELYSTKEAVKLIDVSAFNQGLYFLELIQKDGRHAVKKILFTGN